jgi:Glycine rich protein
MFVVVLVSVASPARAAGDCGAQGATTTCMFRSTGAQDTFVVPAGVTSILVAAVGAPGAVGGFGGGAAGRSARVTGRLAVTPGQTLYVNVGGDPTHDQQCEPRVACVGGFNGGGSSTDVGGGGGGGSDVRTVSYQRAGSLGSRLIVAGGGGGSGGGTEDFCKPPPGLGGAGGDAGSNGSPGVNCGSIADSPGGLQARPRPVARGDSLAASAGCWGRVA